MADGKTPQQAQEEQMETPLFVCGHCGETIIVYNGHAFKTCYCAGELNIVATQEAIRLGLFNGL